LTITKTQREVRESQRKLRQAEHDAAWIRSGIFADLYAIFLASVIQRWNEPQGLQFDGDYLMSILYLGGLREGSGEGEGGQGGTGGGEEGSHVQRRLLARILPVHTTQEEEVGPSFRPHTLGKVEECWIK
jgi:hypothetical protein